MSLVIEAALYTGMGFVTATAVGMALITAGLAYFVGATTFRAAMDKREPYRLVIGIIGVAFTVVMVAGTFGLLVSAGMLWGMI